MNTDHTSADYWKVVGFLYEPIPHYAGKVLKHAGTAIKGNVERMMAKPGMVLLPAYIADRITADTHQPFTGS